MAQAMMIVPAVAQLPALCQAVEVRPLCVDDMAHVRYLHAAAMRVQASQWLTSEEIAAFTGLVNEPDYTARLLSECMLTAWLGPELVGTAGWGAAGDARGTARIHSVFTRPLFTRSGIGRRLVSAVEAGARLAGYADFCVRSTVNAVGFFERAGYEVTAHGVRSIGAESLAVAFMRKSDRDTVSARSALAAVG